MLESLSRQSSTASMVFADPKTGRGVPKPKDAKKKKPEKPKPGKADPKKKKG